jgi:hypothetical protein
MPTSALTTISKRRVLSSSEIARQRLVRFAEICQREIGSVLPSIWAEQLADIPPEKLNLACDRLEKTWRSGFLPTIGDVRAQLDDAESKAFDLAAENEWQRLLAWIRENYFPDTGIRRGAPRLAPAVEHAARAAGGFHFLEGCTQSQLVWCRKTFLAAYRNVHETGQVENLLGDGQAKQILARFKAGPREEPKPLPAVEIVSERPSREEIRESLKRAIEEKSQPVQEDTEEDLAARWARQKHALLERAAELGLGAKSQPDVFATRE